MEDTVWMRRALELARKGFPKATPNPLVGCVLVKNGRKISEGYHAQFGGPHAEIQALKRAKNRAKGATAYLTLEPCSHFGKTPPCTDALIRAGVRRVIAAMKDPNPKVNGRGAKTLTRAKIKCEFGLMEREAAALNLPFVTSNNKNRPYIVLKAAQTLDGKITDYRGDSKWITDEATRDYSRQMRGKFDAIAVGVGTVIKDDPRLTSTNGRNPLRLILDPKLRTPLKSKITHTHVAPTAIATLHQQVTPRLVGLTGKNVEILDIKKKTSKNIDLVKLCSLLELKGVQTLLVEGGAETHARFIEAGLVDELLWFIAPKILGGRTSLTSVEGNGIPIEKALHFNAINSDIVGETLVIRATRHPQSLFWPVIQTYS